MVDERAISVWREVTGVYNSDDPGQLRWHVYTVARAQRRAKDSLLDYRKRTYMSYRFRRGSFRALFRLE